jgi:hypothetical protein
MGAMWFVDVVVARTPEQAFIKAVKDARYWNGHGGYTGTIAEKGEFKFFGQLGSRYVDRIETYFDYADEWFHSTDGRKAAKPKGVPEPIREVILKALPTYDDKWGPAVCFEITGRKAKEIKDNAGRKGTWDKVYLFAGKASS